MGDDESSVEKGIESPDVVDKYKSAAEIATSAIELLRRACYAGMKVSTMCSLGDKKIENAVSNVYTKAKNENNKTIDKGVAFPTCVSVNHCAAHYCPLPTDPDNETLLNAGDVLTVQVGCHIDGYTAISAQTLVARASKDDPTPPPLKDKRADAVAAAYTAADAALRLMRPGGKNSAVTEVIEKVASNFGVTALEGVLSHQMKRWVVDGSKVIANKATAEARVDEWEFEANEVYNLDVVMSTGEGKVKEQGAKETVYKRQVDVEYQLKLKASRQVFSVINQKYPVLPFSLRNLGDDMRKSRMAITEMKNHNLLVSYPVLYEKPGETVARCSVTVLVLPSKTLRITDVAQPVCQTEVMLDEEVKALLAISLNKKKKKKKAKKTTGEDTAPMETGE